VSMQLWFIPKLPRMDTKLRVINTYTISYFYCTISFLDVSDDTPHSSEFSEKHTDKICY